MSLLSCFLIDIMKLGICENEFVSNGNIPVLSSLLITLREGLEAALIIGIILAFLNSSGYRKWFKYIWFGTPAAMTVSAIVGGVLFSTVGALEGRVEEIFEGSAMLLAAGVLTWMIFWMRKQSVNIKGQLHGEIQSALSSGSTLALMGIAFIAVVREGIETTLFLFAATRETESNLLSIVGGVTGLVAAIAIGYALYKGSTKLNLRAFFNVTGLLLILFAAGLIAHGVHEYQEAGLLPIVVEHVWDINGFLPESSIFGNFLSAVFGYNGNPSLLEVIVYIGYISFVSILSLGWLNRRQIIDMNRV